MRVLVVDDSAFMRRAVSQMLSSDGHIQVIGTAKNGREGIEMAARLKPDVITLDIEMPDVDGLTALRRIMRQCPTRVLMLSSLTTEGSHAALQALKLGAADVLAKDMSQVCLSVTNIQNELVARVRALGASRAPVGVKPALDAGSPDKPPTFRCGQFDVVCIGSSTGGPPVLERILTALPGSFKTPVVVAQHMPEVFTRSMSQRLDEACKLRVVHAHDQMPLASGTIYIAPGGKHIHLNKVGLTHWQLLVNGNPPEALYKPSVDALFHSAAEHVGPRCLAMVLTGIGSDGLEGGRALNARGGVILAQSEDSCVVYGMPKSVTDDNLVAARLGPDQLAASLLTLAAGSDQRVA